MGSCHPATSRSYPMCVVRQHARRPPFRLVRGSVADPSADMRARGKLELKWRAVPRPNRATYRLLLRFVVSGSSSLSSQLFLEALGCSRRVLGLILRLFHR